MAAIYKRKLKNGRHSWRAVVRFQDHPSVCETFERKQEAEDWAADVERRIKQGKFKFDQHKQKYTFGDIVDRYIQDGALQHHRSAKDTLRHLNYWKERLGQYGLVYLTIDRIGKERHVLIDSPFMTGQSRSTATVNRYMASLSALLSYAVRQLRWMHENPCLTLKKLKENPGRDRILNLEELKRLLASCRQSRSPYLYCITLIALTTGARQGEILNLKWQDIDFANQIAHLKETKNGHSRGIFLVDPIIEELKVIYSQRQKQKDFIFASKTAFGRIDIKKAWKEALKRAGIQNFRAHDMRHTFATYASSRGASNIQLGTAMGHRTLEMLQRYTHLDDVQVSQEFSIEMATNLLGDAYATKS
jgi:integrase